jgi:hypothetical protein
VQGVQGVHGMVSVTLPNGELLDEPGRGVSAQGPPGSHGVDHLAAYASSVPVQEDVL